MAVDRARVQALFGGETAARSTCQILPPGFPGYEPYCPYTRDPGGTWSEADLAEARRLVREAGAVSAHVTYWTAKDGLIPGSVEVTKYIARQLVRIGLDAELRPVPDTGAYFAKLIGSGRREIQMFDNGWFSDYPGVSGYIGPLFRCGAPQNFQGFCDPNVDDAMRRAQRLALDDPAAAYEAWTEIDRRLVDMAAALPLVNTVQSHAISDRVKNAQIHPQWGLLINRLWVR
jgi:peptide/nickel transport system substrate-binding protein